MRAKALEIAWHEKAPIWSVDVSPSNRLVTAGGDKVARVWRLSPSTTPPELPVEWLCDLRAHLTTVNVARFSRSGFCIATGADQGEIVVWRLSPDTEGTGAPSPLEAATEGADGAPIPRERWGHDATLRGHHQDVLDLSWGADGYTLVSASVDNTILVWDTRNPSRPPTVLRAHSNYVQGVAIDPVGKIIASLGNDRALRIFSKAGLTPWAPIAVATAITADSKLFANDTKFKIFFRRLAWSPDGSVLACPSGLHFPSAKRMFAVHLFARNHWSVPAAQCGGLTKPACAVRFSPVLYALRKQGTTNEDVATPEAQSQSCTASQSSQKSGEESTKESSDVRPRKKFGPFEGFTYRMIFAVACVDAVLFYDTEAFTRPFATVEGLHCAELTDIAWSSDGLTVMLSSMDGYSSIITFTEEELGPRLREDQTPRWLREYNLQRQHSETGVLIKAIRVSPQSSRPPSCVAAIPRSDSAKDVNVKLGTPPFLPKDVLDRKALCPRAQRLHVENIPGKLGLSTPSADMHVKELESVTLRKSSGQGFRIAAVEPVEPTKDSEGPDSATMPKSEDAGQVQKSTEASGAMFVEPNVVQSIMKKEEDKAPEVKLVVPKRRLKQSLPSHCTVSGDSGLPSVQISAAKGGVNEVVVSDEAAEPITKVIEEKRRPKSGSMVQTRFSTTLITNVEKADGNAKRDRDALTVSLEGRQPKRQETEGGSVLDLT